MSTARASMVITLDLITSAWCSEQRFTTYSCSAQWWWPSNEAAICVGQVFMNSSQRRKLAGEDLSVKTDGQEKKEEAIKLGKPYWVSPSGRMNCRRLVMLNVRMQHIISDWSFLHWLEWIKFKRIVQFIKSRDLWRGIRSLLETWEAVYLWVSIKFRHQTPLYKNL